MFRINYTLSVQVLLHYWIVSLLYPFMNAEHKAVATEYDGHVQNVHKKRIWLHFFAHSQQTKHGQYRYAETGKGHIHCEMYKQLAKPMKNGTIRSQSIILTDAMHRVRRIKVEKFAAFFWQIALIDSSNLEHLNCCVVTMNDGQHVDHIEDVSQTSVQHD